MTRYSLFYSVRSPFARRVRVALGKLNIPFEAREISVFEPPAELKEANPLGQVPVLVAHDPKDPFAIPDSSTILEFLHENYGNRIWPPDLAARARVRAAATLAEGVMTFTVSRFLETTRKVPSVEFELEYEEGIAATLENIAAQPLLQMPWKVSDLQLTQAGYDLMIALDYLDVRAPHIPWRSRWPALQKFHEKHRSRSDLLPTVPPA